MKAEKMLLDMQTNWMVKTTVASAIEEPEIKQQEPEREQQEPEIEQQEPEAEDEKSKIWLKNKPGMSNWSVERLLSWANRKKGSRHVSQGVQRVVDKIFELYRPKKEVEQQPEISEIARMRIGMAEQSGEAMQHVSNYYLTHQKEESDNLGLILKLQNKVNFSCFPA